MSKGTDAFRDASFVRRLRNGDPQATRLVVREYLPQIVRAARGAGLPGTTAEDVAQDTFLTFLSAVRRFEGRSHVRTFLFGILYKKIAEKRRERARERRSDSIDEVMESRFRPDGRWHKPPRPIEDSVRGGEVRRQINDCLEELTTNQRMAFVLREVEGMETKEISEAMEVSRNNVGVLLYRARNRLRECLESAGVTP